MNLGLHHYDVTVTWTGNLGTGTEHYRSYSRDHDIQLPGLPTLPGSADPHFRGDASRYNPEQLLLSALSQCHMLSYLHVAVQHGLVVTAYRDEATGTMKVARDGSGNFEQVALHPRVTLRAQEGADENELLALANTLHAEANRLCFIANSVNFPVNHVATAEVMSTPDTSQTTPPNPI